MTEPRRLLLAGILLLVGSCKHSNSVGADAGEADAGAPAPDSGVTDGGAADGGGLPNAGGWWRDKVVYEVFVRSFADGDGDGIGDLAGLSSKLDVLNDGDPSTTSDLGVDAIWLMPIYPSPSYHGYDVTDYRGINSDYGTMADFDAFVAAAHRRGIKVILDFVLNHSSSQHPWFDDARSSVTAQYRDYYNWSDTDKNWKRPWDAADPWWSSDFGFYYGLFSRSMPDLNLGNPPTEQAMTDVARFWAEKGVDGFRVDAARYLFESPDGKLADQPATHAFMKRMRSALAAEHPELLWVAEAWTSSDLVASYYGAGDEFQLAFEFDLASAIQSAVHDRVKADLNQQLSTLVGTYADHGFMAPFLSNHDQPRVMRSLGGVAPGARLAAALLFAMPGTPFVYYGEELGMMGGANTRDEDKRTPMRWTASAPEHGFTTNRRSWYETKTGTTAGEAAGVDTASEIADPQSLWQLYRRLIAVRHAEPALSGRMDLPAVNNPGRGVFALLRSKGDARLLFVANLDASPAPGFSVTVSGTPSVDFSEGLAAPPTAQDGKLSFGALAARGFAFIRL